MPKFEKFRRVNATAAGTPLVAIHQRGVFALNQLAFEALDKPEAVELLYDPQDQIIGFQKASPDSPDSYKVRQHTRYNHQVAGNAFLSFYEIPERVKGRRYKGEMMDGVLAVDLGNPEETDDRGEKR